MVDSYKRREFEPYKKLDLTTFFDKLDFGVPYIDSWSEFEGKLADDYIANLLLKDEKDLE